MGISCFAAYKPKSQLKPFSYEPKKLGDFEIEIKISHCGICHSDIHLIDNDWKSSEYPLVPGHEIIGTVAALGKKVGHLKEGSRVGVGWQRSSCMECEWCSLGEENLCPDNEATCVRNGNYGGFAKAIRTDSRFAFPIPDNLDSDKAAPLLCGGVTVFSPLKRLTNPAMKVGVVGAGGLGHLAIQYAKALGCEVTVFSSSPSKEKEVKEMGASHFISSKDARALKKAANSLDFILTTVNVNLNWPKFMDILRPNGTLCVAGASPGPICLAPFVFIGNQKTVTGSVIGSRKIISEMLNFSSRHNIMARTETLPLAEVNDAIGRLRQRKARYRMVLACD